MKVLLALLSLLALTYGSSTDVAVKNSYEQWKKKYNPTLPDNVAYGIFKKTLQDITLQNLKFFSGKSKFQMKLNGRAADTEAMMSRWNGLIPKKVKKEKKVLPKAVTQTPSFNFPPAPASLDYRQLGYVTPIEDQGFYCGSCYAYAANCALEGQIAKKYGRLVPLSKQNIVDCSRQQGNFGCNGGYMAAAYDYVIENPKMANESAYPYTGVEGTCIYSDEMAAATVDDYFFLDGNEDFLKRALAAIGPLAVGVNGNVESFFFFGSGIYDDVTCNSNVNHAVCVVGYGTDNTTVPPTDYWIIKNSWGIEWGENGYIKLLSGSNMCGITSYVIYPTI